MLVKIYGAAPGGAKRYSPAKGIGAKQQGITGEPDPKHVSTSFVERQNLTLRMPRRRLTRLTNAFSKKIENHAGAVALPSMDYNFVRLHQTLKVSPAMAAGVTDRLWEMVDGVDLRDAFEAKRKRQPKVIFNVAPWRLGSGYDVTVTMPDSEPVRVTDTVATEGEAWRWIKNEADVWLHQRAIAMEAKETSSRSPWPPFSYRGRLRPLRSAVCIGLRTATAGRRGGFSERISVFMRPQCAQLNC
jgi:hypothetical protein